MVFGDFLNDLEMMETAEFSFAMKMLIKTSSKSLII